MARTLRLVRAMLEAGSALAVLGNHEWNAFAYHFEDPELPGEYLRKHDDKNVRQHHIARALLAAGASGLGVFRERPTPEGPVRLPLSFIDKNGTLRVLYIEAHGWEPERLAALRR